MRPPSLIIQKHSRFQSYLHTERNTLTIGYIYQFLQSSAYGFPLRMTWILAQGIRMQFPITIRDWRLVDPLWLLHHLHITVHIDSILLPPCSQLVKVDTLPIDRPNIQSLVPYWFPCRVTDLSTYMSGNGNDWVSTQCMVMRFTFPLHARAWYKMSAQWLMCISRMDGSPSALPLTMP